MAVEWLSKTEGSLNDLLTFLTNNGIGYERVKTIGYDGSNWTAIYVKQ